MRQAEHGFPAGCAAPLDAVARRADFYRAVPRLRRMSKSQAAHPPDPHDGFRRTEDLGKMKIARKMANDGCILKDVFDFTFSYKKSGGFPIQPPIRSGYDPVRVMRIAIRAAPPGL